MNDDDYTDFLVVLVAVEDTGDLQPLREWLSVNKATRPLTPTMRMMLGDLFVKHLLRRRARGERGLVVWKKYPLVHRAIVAAYAQELDEVKKLRKRDRDDRRADEHAADRVCLLSPFNKMNLGRDAVLRAVAATNRD